MTSKSRSRRTPKAAKHPSPGGAPIQLVNVSLREFSYRELEVPGLKNVGEIVEAGGLREQAINVACGVDVAQPDLVQLTISATMTPIGKIKPFELMVKVGGMFRRAPGVTNRRAVELLNEFGVRLLLPFVREALMTLTSKTVFGMILIQPMIIEPPFSAEMIAAIKD